MGQQPSFQVNDCIFYASVRIARVALWLSLFIDVDPARADPRAIPDVSCQRPAATAAFGKFATAKEILLQVGFSPVVFDSLVAHLSHVNGPGYEYPWENCEKDIESTPEHFVWLVGYGSLLSKQSATRTIDGNVVGASQPVLVLGARRLFNYVMPSEGSDRKPGEKTGPARAAPNVEITKSDRDLINGRAFRLYAKDVAKLREREVGYNLRPVACVRWEQPHGKPFTAYILACQRREWRGDVLVDNRLLPKPDYYKLCRDGAESISAEFLAVYLRTTYIPAIGMSLAEWEAKRSKAKSQP